MSTEPTEPTARVSVAVNDKGRPTSTVYHWRQCGARQYTGGPNATRTKLIALSSAQEVGFTPCKSCTTADEKDRRMLQERDSLYVDEIHPLDDPPSVSVRVNGRPHRLRAGEGIEISTGKKLSASTSEGDPLP